MERYSGLNTDTNLRFHIPRPCWQRPLSVVTGLGSGYLQPELLIIRKNLWSYWAGEADGADSCGDMDSVGKQI